MLYFVANNFGSLLFPSSLCVSLAALWVNPLDLRPHIGANLRRKVFLISWSISRECAAIPCLRRASVNAGGEQELLFFRAAVEFRPPSLPSGGCFLLVGQPRADMWPARRGKAVPPDSSSFYRLVQSRKTVVVRGGPKPLRWATPRSRVGEGAVGPGIRNGWPRRGRTNRPRVTAAGEERLLPRTAGKDGPLSAGQSAIALAQDYADSPGRNWPNGRRRRRGGGAGDLALVQIRGRRKAPTIRKSAPACWHETRGGQGWGGGGGGPAETRYVAALGGVEFQATRHSRGRHVRHHQLVMGRRGPVRG